MALISLKLPDLLTLQLSEQAQRRQLSKSELTRRALKAFLPSPNELGSPSLPSACELVADLVGCCEGAPADLSTNPDHLATFGER